MFQAILAGDFILAQAARILAQLDNEDVVHLLAQVRPFKYNTFTLCMCDEFCVISFVHYLPFQPQ